MLKGRGLTSMTPLNQIGRQAVTVTTAAIGLTPPTNKRPRHALIFCGPVGAATTNFVRWRADAAPTASQGMILQVGDYLDLTGLDDYSSVISSIQFFRDTGAQADATLEVAYFD